MQPDRNTRYLWTDVQHFDEDQRWELIDGYPFAMSSPLTVHQVISMQLTASLLPLLRGGPCRLLAAPMDVKLSERDLVQPDLLVVCDPSQFQRTHIEGAPRVGVEILSDSSLRHDRLRKMNLYARAGVSEYWIVTPHLPMVEVFSNQNGHFVVAGSYTESDMLRSPAFPDWALELAPVFENLPPQPLIDEVREATPEYMAEMFARLQQTPKEGPALRP